MDTTEQMNLPNMVRDITYYFIKYYYEKELKTHNVTILPDEYVKTMINNLYTEKSQELKKYIRSNLKSNLGNNYNIIAIENIILEMFSNQEYSKQRIYLEIIEYQKKISNNPT